MKLSVIVTAGGSSSRYGNKNKLLEKIDGKEVILHSINAFLQFNPHEVIVSATADFEVELKKLLNQNNLQFVKIIRGGATRQDSVYNALQVCDNPDFVAIHDAARPLVLKRDIENCLEKSLLTGAAICAVRAVDTIKKTDEDGKIVETPDRNFLWYVQTPQIFDYTLVLEAHRKLEGKGFSDDAGLVEACGHDVYVCEGNYSNIKITTKKDLYIAQMIYTDLSNF